MISHSAMDFIERLSTLTTRDDVFTESEAYFATHGLDKMIYFFRENPSNKSQSAVIHHHSNLPSSWWDWYHDNNYHNCDPFFDLCCHTYQSIFTGADVLSDWPMFTSKQKKLVAEVSEIDFNSGLGMPMKLAQHNGNYGGWNLGSSLRLSEFKSQCEQILSDIQLAALFSHHHLNKIKDKKPTTIKLSNREKECLLWLSQGLKTQAISEKINIQPVTVDFHIKNARLKLNALTREQALAIAIHEGLISI